MRRLLLVVLLAPLAIACSGNTSSGSASSTTSLTFGTLGGTGASTGSGTHGATAGSGSSGSQATTSAVGPTSGVATSGSASRSTASGSGGHSTSSSAAASTGGAASTTSSSGSTACVNDGGITEFLGCLSDAQCACGQSCVADPLISNPETNTVCEYRCTSSAGCPNAATFCGGDAGPGGSTTCSVNLCDRDGTTNLVVGSVCDATSPGSADGTCVPQSEANLVCMPNGTANHVCSNTTDDDPLYSGNTNGWDPVYLAVASPQPRTASLYCKAGQACQEPDGGGSGGSCATLCIPRSTPSPCTGSDVCVVQDDGDVSWGFCQTCKANGSSCEFDGDCCANLCTATQVCGCQAAGATCNLDSDCCSNTCTGNACG